MSDMFDLPILEMFGEEGPAPPPAPAPITAAPITITGDSSLDEARRFVQAHSEEGVECPCCSQYFRIYKRALNSPMARFLIWLVRKFETVPRWYELKEFPMIQKRRGGGDFAKLAHWGLIEQKPNEDDTKRTSGIWRPTQKGIDFVHLRSTLPSHVHLLKNEIVGFSDRSTDIKGALGKDFSYSELMSQ